MFGYNHNNSTRFNTRIINCTTSNTIGEKLMGKKLYIKGDADSGHHPLNMSFSPPHKFCGTINANSIL